MPKAKKTPVNIKKANVDVFDLTGKISGALVYPKQLFDTPLNEHVVAQAVHVYQMNRLQGTRSTKTRAEVTGSTRKIYRQKGTGRARHGDIKAPIFVGGGITHGPKPVDYRRKLTKSMRRKALVSVLSERFRQGKITIIEGLNTVEGKTKKLAALLDGLKISPKFSLSRKSLLMVLANSLPQVERSARNIPSLSLVGAAQLNIYHLLSHKYALVEKAALPILEKMYTQKTRSVKKVSPAVHAQLGTKRSQKVARQTDRPRKTKSTIAKKKSMKPQGQRLI